MSRLPGLLGRAYVYFNSLIISRDHVACLASHFVICLYIVLIERATKLSSRALYSKESHHEHGI